MREVGAGSRGRRSAEGGSRLWEILCVISVLLTTEGVWTPRPSPLKADISGFHGQEVVELGASVGVSTALTSWGSAFLQGVSYC